MLLFSCGFNLICFVGLAIAVCWLSLICLFAGRFEFVFACLLLCLVVYCFVSSVLICLFTWDCGSVNSVVIVYFCL